MLTFDLDPDGTHQHYHIDGDRHEHSHHQQLWRSAYDNQGGRRCDSGHEERYMNCRSTGWRVYCDDESGWSCFQIDRYHREEVHHLFEKIWRAASDPRSPQHWSHDDESFARHDSKTYGDFLSMSHSAHRLVHTWWSLDGYAWKYGQRNYQRQLRCCDESSYMDQSDRH